MRTVLWVLGWVGVGVWTLLAVVGWAAMGLFGEVARSTSGQVPGFPVETFSIAWLVDMAHSFGIFALLFVWALGTLMILAVPAIAGFFLRRRDDRRRASVPVDPRIARVPAGSSRGPMPFPTDLGRSDTGRGTIAGKILRPFPRRRG